MKGKAIGGLAILLYAVGGGVAASQRDDLDSAPRVTAGGGTDLKLTYVRHYTKMGVGDVTTGVGKKAKLTGSLLVENLLPEPLAQARVLLVISAWGKTVITPIEAVFDPPIAVGEIGTTSVDAAVNLSKVHSLDDLLTSASLRVADARGVARAVSVRGDAGTGAVTASIAKTTLSAQVIYRGVDGAPASYGDGFDLIRQLHGGRANGTVVDTLSGTASVTVSNGSEASLVRVRVGIADGGTNVSMVEGERFVVLDPPLAPQETRTVDIAVGATVVLASTSPQFASGAVTSVVYDELAATEPAPVRLQKATPLLDAPTGGAKIAKLVKKTAVVELGLPEGGMVQVRAGDQQGWIKVSALGKKVKLPGSKKTGKHKGRATDAGDYVAACDLAKVKGVKARVDADGYLITYERQNVRLFPGAAKAEVHMGTASPALVSIDLPPYGDPACPFVSAKFLRDELF